MKRNRCLLWGATVIAMSVFGASESRADCRGEFGGVSMGIAAVVGTLPTGLISTFVAPAIAVAADDSLDYGGGVAWSAVGAFSFGGATTGMMFIECPEPAGFFVPGAMAIAGSAITTTLWGIASSDDDPNPPFAVGIEPQAGGAMVTLGGRF